MVANRISNLFSEIDVKSLLLLPFESKPEVGLPEGFYDLGNVISPDATSTNIPS